MTLSREDGAWSQYVQLAKWLVYLASILELRGTAVEQTFLEATEYSTDNMRKKYLLGYSWHAYPVWNRGWSKICSDNRALIRDFLTAKGTHADVEEIIARG